MFRALGLFKKRNRDIKAKLIAIEKNADGYRSAFCFYRLPIEPIAPAGFYSGPKIIQEVFCVHRHVNRVGNVVIFETFETKELKLPAIGTKLYYRGWWQLQALAACLDTDAHWELRQYPDNGDHNHCLFTWERIAAYSENTSGYWSAKHGWITEMAYDKYIRNDIYRIRGHKNI